jgi:NADPH-dependent 2,4-dienoyl-CoA reductase/sulfur reductase-like enzyme
MPDSDRHFDIVIVGAGPAGIAAACTAAETFGPRAPQRVLVIDNMPAPGGNIWRGPSTPKKVKLAGKWLARMQAARPSLLSNATVFAIDLPAPGTAGPAPRRLHVETADAVLHISFDKLILATGARELFLPFPGWTLPNVLGVGGLQALVKQGWPIKGKRIVVAGSGPLLLAAAAQFIDEHAIVTAIAEQAPFARLASFASSLTTLAPSKLLQAMALRAKVFGHNFRTDTWVAAAHGNDHLQAVTLTNGSATWQQPCDYLACAYGLIPSLELPMMLNCQLANRWGGQVVQTDDMQRTSVGGVFCAGEPLGIGGADCALVEGQIAGYAAAGAIEQAANLVRAAIKANRFRAALAETFALRPELKALATPDTLICRCEDVTKARLDACADWRSAKLHTRCGMGPCQGRICGGATAHLYGWQNTSIRPPVLPVRLDALAHLAPPSPPA